MIKKYPYLKDVNFLNKLYGQHNKTIYTTITCLDWDEKPIKSIEGKVISGSMNCNGDSAIRRTANLSIKIANHDELYNSNDSLFAINRKVFIEVGLKNNLAHLGYYSNYPIIKFPFGTFIIQSESLSHDVSGVTLNLSLGDKMCLLNGTAGGTLPAAINFESIDTLGPDGDLHTDYVQINQLIREMVNHFGNEDLNKIIINDIPDRIKQVLKWRNSNPLYLWMNKNDRNDALYTTINSNDILDPDEYNKKTILYNYDCGYSYVNFVYPGELVASPGDTVCTMLDKLKQTLGNYEYYYDVFGNFIFQEIKNYVNISEWRNTNVYGEQGDVLKDSNAYLPYNYLPRLNSAVYNFTNNDFVVSYSNSPKFDMIKNDFVVWGEKTNSNNIKMPCRYHIAIDKRPSLTEDWVFNKPICFDINLNDKIKRAFYTETVTDISTEAERIVGQYYYYNSKIYSWITDIDNYKLLLTNYFSSERGQTFDADSLDIIAFGEKNIGFVEMVLAHYKPVGDFIIHPTTNWRNILYFQGLEDSINGLNTNYYWAEMCNEWPKLYDIEDDDWYDGVLDMPTSLDWWLDLIDNNPILNKFSVSTIGRRSYSKNDSKCNCVFEPDIPDIVMVNVGETGTDYRSQETQNRLKELGLIPVQVSEPIYDSVITGGTFNSCYQHIRQIITDYTNYNETISVTALPLYHLEPNTRVSFNDPDSGIYGDYIINSISFDLSNGGTMNINATKCIEKI